MSTNAKLTADLAALQAIIATPGRNESAIRNQAVVLARILHDVLSATAVTTTTTTATSSLALGDSL